MKNNKLMLGLGAIFSFALLSCGAKPSMDGSNKAESASAATESANTISNAPVQDAKLNPQGNATASSTELVWYGFEEGMEKAKKEKKVLLVDAYTDWCGWCKVMDRETYKNAEVIAKLNKDFVAVKFNPEIDKRYNVDGTTQNGEGLLMWLAQGNPGGYPTSYFVFNPSKNYNRAAQPGYLAPADFIKLLDLVLTKRGS
ncbi:MAG: thioredoxin family protein [Bacteroidota bacterium]|jgi:thiol:disulfide interchange protein